MLNNDTPEVERKIVENGVCLNPPCLLDHNCNGCVYFDYCNVEIKGRKKHTNKKYKNNKN